MQFELTQVSGRVTRRTLLTILACGLVPVLVLAGIGYKAVSTSLVRNASARLAAETDAHASLVTDRVERLANVLHGSIDSVPLGNNGIPVRNLSSRAHFDAVLLETAQDRVTRSLGTMAARPTLSDAENESLRNGRPVLLVGARKNKHNTMFLVVSTGKDGPGFPRVWGHATIASALGDLDDGSAQKDFCVYADGAPIYCRADGNVVPLGADVATPSGVMTSRVNGSTMLSAYGRLGADHGFGSTSWYLVMSSPQSAALAPLALMRTVMTFGLVITALVLVGISQLLSRRRVTPLVSLTSAVDQLRAGDYTARVEPTSADEFEALTDGFNQMARELERRFSTFDTMHRVDLALLEQHTAAAVSGTVSEGIPALLNATAVAVVTARREDPLRWCGEVMAPDRLPQRIDVMVTRSVASALRQTPDWFIVGASDPLPDYCAALTRRAGASVVIFPMMQFGRPFGVLAVALHPDVMATPRMLASARQIATQLALGMANAARLDDLELASNGALVALARAIDTASQWTERHSERVADLAVNIAKRVGLDEKLQMMLRRAALVHDIGKLRLPRALLDKTGELTDAESRAIQSHTVLGAEMLLSIPAFRDVMPLVQQHHELLDGSGYPNGLQAEKLSPAVRVLTVADVYDALVSDRPYREGLTPEGALGILRRGAGTSSSMSAWSQPWPRSSRPTRRRRAQVVSPPGWNGRSRRSSRRCSRRGELGVVTRRHPISRSRPQSRHSESGDPSLRNHIAIATLRILIGSGRSVHPAHATTAATTHRRRLVFLPLHHDAFRRQQQRRDRRGVLQRGARHLGRVDDAGLDQVFVHVGRGVVAEGALSFDSLTRARTIEPSTPALIAMARIGSSIARRMMSTPIFSSPEALTLSSAAWQRISATPPPGTMPSSTAARVACSASSTRAFFSFISVSVAAPTWMTATPPASFASRSCSFSLS